jgi:hypothetical protein
MALTTVYRCAAAVAACILLAAALVPPRLARPFRSAPALETPEALAFQQAHREYRAAEAEWITAVLSDSAARLARALPPARDSGPRVVYDPLLAPAMRSRLARIIGDEWRQLGVERPAMPIVVAVLVDTSPTIRGQRREVYGATRMQYVVPNAASPSAPCIAILRLGGASKSLEWIDRRFVRDATLPLNSRQSIFGPCAFHAKFGAPGPRIAQWLTLRASDIARNANWSVATRPENQDWITHSMLAGMMHASDIQRTSLEAHACLLHDIDACERTIIDAPALDPADAWGAGGLFSSGGDWERPWRGTEARVLADLLRDMGTDRFQRFWSSPEEPAAAFAAVMGMPLGEWTHRWATGIFGPTSAGSGVSMAAGLEGLLVLLAGFGAAAWMAGRRQVG